MTWREFEAEAPALAQSAKARLEETRVALLGTIRPDGSPRISPIEPYFTSEALLIGAMASSAKVGDLQRDARCVLHSVIAAPDAGETEFKLYGRAAEVREPSLRNARADAWWLSHPPDAAHVFAFEVDEVTAVAWVLERGEMTVTRWSSQRGLGETTRSYP